MRFDLFENDKKYVWRRKKFMRVSGCAHTKKDFEMARKHFSASKIQNFRVMGTHP
jgi:hypothetical protein